MFVGWPVRQRRLFIVVAMCALREAPRPIHDAIVVVVIGWGFGARHLRGSAEGR
jgi:hypothetical protein